MLKLRPLSSEDYPVIDEWISRDPDHSSKGWTSANFNGLVAFVVEDEVGVIMFLGVEGGPLARMYIQFDTGQERRTALALNECSPKIKEGLKNAGCTQLVFESVSRPLIAFCKRRLGFTRVLDSNDYITTL